MGRSSGTTDQVVAEEGKIALFWTTDVRDW